LTQRMLLAFAALGLAPVVILGVLSVSKSTSTIRDQAGEGLRTLQGATSQEIDLYFTERRFDTRVTAANVGVVRGRGDPLSEVRAHLNDVVEGYGATYEWAAFADAKGRIVASSDGSGEGRSVGDERWFREGLEKYTASPARRWADLADKPAFAFSAPVESRRAKSLGVLTLRAGFTALSRRIEAAVPDNGHALLIDRKGHLITAQSRHGGKLLSGNSIISQAGDQLATVIPLATRIETLAARRFGVSGERGLVEAAGLHGGDALSAFGPVGPESLGLGLVVEEDLDALFTPADAIRNQALLIGLLVVIGLAAAGVYFARRLGVPVEQLRDSERRNRALVRASTAVVWMADRTGAFALEQPAWAGYTGQSWEQQAGFGWI
ncbi:hypothetical protein LCGC14_2930000, partial [marine sediment metagenome]